MATLPTTPRVALIQQVLQLGLDQQELTSILRDDRPSATISLVSIQENLVDIYNLDTVVSYNKDSDDDRSALLGSAGLTPF